jgi:hypothetical protein
MGHFWVKLDSESFGWWPKYRVSGEGILSNSINAVLGVEGELNGQTTFGGTETTDPHHNDTGKEVYQPNKRHIGRLKFGARKEQSCRCVSDDDIKECIRKFAKDFSIKNDRWSYPFGNNCHSFQRRMMNACCMYL